MIKNKLEIKIYYETHHIKPKELAKMFNVKYRTIIEWINKEGWEEAKTLKQIPKEAVQGELLKKEFGTAMQLASQKTKQAIKENLGDEAYEINAMILDNMLDSSTEELLLSAMNANYIQKNIALSAIIAKDELMKMLRLRRDDRAEPAIIACAEKVNKLFLDMQFALYGKEVPTDNIINDYENLSTEELLKTLKNL